MLAHFLLFLSFSSSSSSSFSHPFLLPSTLPSSHPLLGHRLKWLTSSQSWPFCNRREVRTSLASRSWRSIASSTNRYMYAVCLTLHALTQTCMPSHRPACPHTDLHALTQTCMPSHRPACPRTDLHAFAQTCMPSHRPACPHTDLRALTHTCMISTAVYIP